MSTITRPELYGTEAATLGLGVAANQLYNAFAPKKINPTKKAIANLEKDVLDMAKKSFKDIMPSEKTVKNTGYIAITGLAVAGAAVVLSLFKGKKAFVVKK